MPDLAGSVHLQLSTLLLDAEGRLTERIQAGRTLRAALLVDLVGAGALRNDPDSIEIVPTAGLLPLAARMLGDMTAEPDRDLIWWAHHDHLSVEDAAGQMVDLGLWHRSEHAWGLEHRYAWRDDRSELATALRAAVGPDYDRADSGLVGPNLALVGGLWGRPPRPPEDDVIAALGQDNWIVPELIDYLWRSAAQLRLVR